MAASPPVVVLECVLAWAGIGLAIGWLTNWFDLQRRFPDKDEKPYLVLRMRSGAMGYVLLKNMLSLSACPSGLRISALRLVTPFQKPFFVPWSEIYPSQERRWIRLGLGGSGELKINPSAWQRLSCQGLNPHR